MSLAIRKIHAFNHRPAGTSDKDAVHLQLLSRIVPRLIREARERGLAAEVAERCRALDAIFATWRTPFTSEELAEFRGAFGDS